LTPRRANSFDVAKAAGVSRTTVSFVLNQVPGVSISEATRERVLEAARRLNYHPDASGRRLASGRSRTLGLVLRQSPEQVFADAFLVQVLLGVEQAAAQHGYHVLLKPLEPGDPGAYARLIRENHVDGIILSGPRHSDDAIHRLHDDGFPIVLIGQLPGIDIPFVDIDAVEGSATVVRHLLELGHRRIAMITNASLEYTSAQQRRAGYHQALREVGLTPGDALLREGDYTPASGYAAMSGLLESLEPPDAVFVASDVVAMGAVQAVKRAGLRIPADIAVAGFDDVPLAAYFDPPLTTVHLPAYGLGWAAGERLVRLVNGETLDETGVLLGSQLVVRASSGGLSG
jgi:DNA-binding LacI/PurR family transcriptional regulator